ncbi:MAG TPA: hypothetical protein DCZ41_00540 [Firmicutes bacterium]|nr:hypothetical protein [Bacillota bacterium]
MREVLQKQAIFRLFFEYRFNSPFYGIPCFRLKTLRDKTQWNFTNKAAKSLLSNLPTVFQ